MRQEIGQRGPRTVATGRLKTPATGRLSSQTSVVKRRGDIIQW